MKININLILGDIAEQKADAIVNAAGTSLTMGGGVAGALKRKGGKNVEEEAVKHAPAKLGEVIVTGAGKLNARFVLHAAAQPHYGNFKATEESVRKAMKNILLEAEELKCKSIAIPALGCGIAGLDIEKGAKTILGKINEFKADIVDEIKVVLFSKEDFDVFNKELNKLCK